MLACEIIQLNFVSGIKWQDEEFESGDEDDDDVDDFEDGELEGDNDDEYVRGMIHPPCVHQRRGLFLQGTQSQCIDAKIRRKPI